MSRSSLRGPARKSLIYGTNRFKCICETLRLIYDEIYTLEDSEKKERITELLVDALLMSKKMHQRLVYYKKTYVQDTTGHNAKNLIMLSGNKERAIMRRARA
jgi:hypothetical protein